ncbi:MAG TPA: thiamine pyrophosphate-binding protein [Actinomycetota bacterium]
MPEKLTGGQIVAEYLAREEVPYVLAIPGHGNVALLDAFVDRSDIRVLPVVHEQCAVHIADAYYRVAGRPLAVSTSIGPGAVNAAAGLAQCYVDSTAVLLITGSPHTYMRGRGVLQEIERDHPANFPRLVEPIVKRWWQPSSVEELPWTLHRAFNQMLSGRRGPVLIDLAMDLQAESAEVEIPEPRTRRSDGGPHPSADLVERAGRLLAGARRPAIVAGGGVITAEASGELLALAELIGAPVATTWMGKGAFPEDHELCVWHPGDIGSSCANEVLRAADVILSVGYRFVDWTASSYRSGVTYAIPPTKLVQVDLDEHEIGKNYPAEVGIVADARATLAGLTSWLRANGGARDWRTGGYFTEVRSLVDAWRASWRERRESDATPVSISRALVEIREVLDRDAIVVTGAGLPQSQVYQELPVYLPRTHITSGGFSTMGFTVPGAIGAKLAAPGTQVVGIAGDGDFALNVQELSTAVQWGLPVVYVVFNNHAWLSINNLQRGAYAPDRELITRFRSGGESFSPSFADIARGFGCWAEVVEKPSAIGDALRRALASGRPAVLEIPTATEGPDAQLSKFGWWDVPVPEYLTEPRAAYERERGEVTPP